MKLRNLVTRFGLATLVFSGVVNCGSEIGTGVEASDPDEIVGANAVGRNMTVNGVVYVRQGASDTEVTDAVRAQVRVLFGSFKAMEIGLSDRDARTIDATTFRRDVVTVIDTTNSNREVQQVERVRYSYRDRAVVVKSLASRRTIGTTTLASRAAYTNEIVQTCQSEHRDWGPAELWYNFEPETSTCKPLISTETSTINTDRRKLSDADHQITLSEYNRRFLPVTARFTSIAQPNQVAYPDYQRLYEDDRFVAFSFFGLDKEDDPRDYGGKNAFTFIRTLLNSQLNLRITAVSDNANLLNVAWNGRTISNVTYDRILGWILDDTNYPTEVTYADRSAFRLQILRQWRGHYVTLSMPGSVSISGQAHNVNIEVRVYYGDEESWNSGAVNRYKTAFRDADVFQYTGHSHLGSGPLDGRNYSATDFPTRYQIMMVNSCVSFNYYNQYFALHPGGTTNLDTVTNGLPVYLEGSGLSSARFVNAMIDGRFRNYSEILQSMKVDLPWESGHDANRVADGETDNTFTPTRFPMTLTTRAPN